MSLSRLDSHLSSLISSLYLALLFFLPLLFSMKSSEVFEFPKMLFVYAMTVFIVACWIGRMIINRRIIYEKTPLDIPIFLFLLSQLLSTLFSIDLHTSIFGYYSRWNGGLLSTIAYTLLYAAYTSNKRQVTGDKQSANGNSQMAIRSDKSRFAMNDLRLTIYAVLASATLVALYAILQRLGVDKNLWVQDVVSRVFSTQGQPNWLAAYLVMVLPFAWMKLVTGDRPSSRGPQVFDSEVAQAFVSSSLKASQSLNGPRTQPRGTRGIEGRQATGRILFGFFFWLVACNLLLVALFFTRSRSGLLGLAVSFVVFWGLVIAASDRRQATGKKIVQSFLLVTCSLFLVALFTNNPTREWLLQRIQSSRLADGRAEFRIQNFSSPGTRNQEPGTDSITPSSDIRRIVWTGALQLVKERPWFGWGPETFAYTYWKVRPVAHNMTSEWNFLYNKAHNEWLNLAANTGLFGLGTHLLMLGSLVVWAMKTLQAFAPSSVRGATGYRLQAKTENGDELDACRLLLVTTTSALLGAEVVNFFGFSTVTTQAYRYMLMGIAIVTISKIKDEKSKMENGRNELRMTNYELRIPFTVYCVVFTVSLVTLYLLSQLSFSFLADLSYNRGKQYAKAGYLSEALAAIDAAVSLVPDEPVFRSELAETQGVLAVSLAAAAASDSPDSPAPLTSLISLKDASLTNFTIVESQSPANVSFLRTRARVTYALGSLDPTLYDQGIELMRRAMEFAPTDPKIPYNLGVMLQDRGQTDEAKLSFEKALELKPDYEEAKQALSSTNLPH